jgi:hypothetical protein
MGRPRREATAATAATAAIDGCHSRIDQHPNRRDIGRHGAEGIGTRESNGKIPRRVKDDMTRILLGRRRDGRSTTKGPEKGKWCMIVRIVTGAGEIEGRTRGHHNASAMAGNLALRRLVDG